MITAEGAALVDRFLPEIVALQSAALAGLSESQRAQLLELLTAVGDSLDRVSLDEVVAAAPPRRRPRRR